MPNLFENFVKQIREWYPNYKKLPTADQINSYYDSFLKQPSFNYKKWICGNKEVPDNYEFKDIPIAKSMEIPANSTKVVEWYIMNPKGSSNNLSYTLEGLYLGL